MTFEMFKPILESYGLKTIDPEVWYPQQLTLDIQRAIKQSSGGSQNLVAIGMKIIETAQFPPMESLQQAVNAFAASYPMNFRNQADKDLIHAEIIEDGLIHVTNSSPHSDDMIFGYVYALVKRFAPKGSHPKVTFQDTSKIDSPDDSVIIVSY